MVNFTPWRTSFPNQYTQSSSSGFVKECSLKNGYCLALELGRVFRENLRLLNTGAVYAWFKDVNNWSNCWEDIFIYWNHCKRTAIFWILRKYTYYRPLFTYFSYYKSSTVDFYKPIKWMAAYSIYLQNTESYENLIAIFLEF